MGGASSREVAVIFSCNRHKEKWRNDVFTFSVIPSFFALAVFLSSIGGKGNKR